VVLIHRVRSENSPSSSGALAPQISISQTSPRILKRFLLVATISSFIALANPFITISNTTFGLCEVALTGTAYVLLDEASTTFQTDKNHSYKGAFSDSSWLHRQNSWKTSGDDNLEACFRDVSFAGAVICAFTSFALERTHINALTFPTYVADTRQVLYLGAVSVITLAASNLLFIVTVSSINSKINISLHFIIPTFRY